MLHVNAHSFEIGYDSAETLMQTQLVHLIRPSVWLVYLSLVLLAFLLALPWLIYLPLVILAFLLAR